MAEEPMNQEQKSQHPSSRKEYNLWESHGLAWLLIYQWILVMGSLAYAAAAMGALWTESHRDPSYWWAVVSLLVLACWAIAMAIASVGIMSQRPRGFLVGMICHLLLEMLALPVMLFLGIGGLIGISQHGWAGAMAELFLIFALMWLPFVLISGCGFYYLRRLRKRLLSS
jgi:hypothetical protein